MLRFFYLFLFSFFAQVSLAAIQLPVPEQQDEAVKIVVLDQHALVYYDGKGLGLMNNSGQRLSPATYFSIHPLGQQMYAVQNQQNGPYALMNAGGKQLTPFDFTEISPFTHQLTRVRRNAPQAENLSHSEYAILSQNGLLVSEWMDSIATVAGDDIFVVRHQNKWGVFHQNNTKYFSKNFEDIGPFNAGLAPAKSDGLWGYIEANGVWVIPPAFKEAKQFVGKFAPVQLKNATKWQLIDRGGILVLSAPYDSVQLYKDGAYGIIKNDGKYFYLNSFAKELSQNRYEQAGQYSEEGIAVVREQQAFYYINLSGDKIFQADSLWTFKDGRGVFRKDNLWGWVDEEGKMLIQPTYDEMIASEGRYLVVRKGQLLLLVDEKGNTIQEINTGKDEIILTNSALIYGVRPAFYLVDILKNQHTLIPYDEVGDISHGMMVVRKDSLYGYMDVNGKETVPPENVAVSMPAENLLMTRKKAGDDFIAYNKSLSQLYTLPPGITFIGPFSESRAKVVNQQGLMGYVNEKGELKIPCKYSVVGDFHSGRAIFRNLNGLFGYLDADGNEVISAVYKFVSDFDTKGFSAVVKDKQFGFLHSSGSLVVPFLYDNVLSLKDGIASVEKEGKVGYINMQNKKIIPFTFDEAYQHVGELALVRMSIYWGYISEKGKVEIPWQFAEAQPFSEGKAWVRLKDKFGAINTRGTYIIPLIYDKALPFNMSYAKVQNKGKWGLVNELGVEIIPPVCNKISEIYQQKVVVEISSNGYGIRTLSK